MSASSEQVPERARAVLEYWFGPGIFDAPFDFYPKDKTPMWFRGGAELDKDIKERFGQDLELIKKGSYDSWRDNGPLSLLAGVVLMDQMSRNIFRGTSESFAADPKALTWSLHAVDSGKNMAVPPMARLFLYMVFEHSEDLNVQEQCVELFTRDVELAKAAGHDALATSLAGFLSYAVMHRDVIARWGRFPHRNVLLGRPSTPEEELGLADGSIKKFG